MSDDPPNKTYKRKRKKTFLRNARKYAKKGYYGRGSHMDADTYQYFVRIMETYNAGFDSDEDKVVFVSNVFEQTEEKEIECSNNQVGCRVIETLLPFANDVVLKRFMEKFSSDLRPLSKDRFASHVLETLVTQSFVRSCNKTIEGSDYYKGFLVKVSKFLLNNLEDYIWDTYGNHVIRTCLENLSQIEKEENNKPNVKIEIKQENISEIPEEYSELVKEYGNRLISWPQFEELCQNELTSGFLQIVLKSLNKVDSKLLRKYLDKLLEMFVSGDDSEETKKPSNYLPDAFLSKPAIMLLETAIQVAGKKKFTQIYAKCFLGRLVKLATTRSTNFAVQKLISSCREKTEFEAIFDELDGSFSNIIDVGHSGIILCLAQTCKRLLSKQGPFVQNIMKCFDCIEPEERHNSIILCLSRLSKFEEIQNKSNENLQKEKLNLHGTLILQVLLDFNKPIKIVNALLNMDTNDVKNLFSNSMGSHIVDSYVRSTFVGEKSRERLVRKMKGTYQDLASSKYGSRAFEAIWNAANSSAKLQIMEELSYKDGAWSNSEFGKIISGKVNLGLYKRKKEDWKTWLNQSNDKVENMFKDVLK